jgi:hypothetical protein
MSALGAGVVSTPSNAGPDPLAADGVGGRAVLAECARDRGERVIVRPTRLGEGFRHDVRALQTDREASLGSATEIMQARLAAFCAAPTAFRPQRSM